MEEQIKEMIEKDLRSICAKLGPAFTPVIEGVWALGFRSAILMTTRLELAEPTNVDILERLEALSAALRKAHKS